MLAHCAPKTHVNKKKKKFVDSREGLIQNGGFSEKSHSGINFAFLVDKIIKTCMRLSVRSGPCVPPAPRPPSIEIPYLFMLFYIGTFPYVLTRMSHIGKVSIKIILSLS